MKVRQFTVLLGCALVVGCHPPTEVRGMYVHHTMSPASVRPMCICGGAAIARLGELSSRPGGT